MMCLLHSRGLLLMGVCCCFLCAETMTGMTGAPAGTGTTTATTATPPGMTGTDTLTHIPRVTGAMPPFAMPAMASLVPIRVAPGVLCSTLFEILVLAAIRPRSPRHLGVGVSD